MWLTVDHVTRFAYDASINEAYTELRLKPLHRDGQRCSSFTLTTEPRATVSEYSDRFGNAVHHFEVLESHARLEYSSTRSMDGLALTNHYQANVSGKLMPGGHSFQETHPKETVAELRAFLA